MKMKTCARLAGGFAVFSLLFWAFSGMTLWSALEDTGSGMLRGLILYVAHAAAIGCACFTFSNDWRDA